MSPQIEDLYDYYSDNRDWNDLGQERQKRIADNFICIFSIFLVLCVILWLVHQLKLCILKRKQKREWNTADTEHNKLIAGCTLPYHKKDEWPLVRQCVQKALMNESFPLQLHRKCARMHR